MSRWAGRFHAGVVHYAAYPEAMRSADVFINSLVRIVADPFFEAVEMMSIPAPILRVRVREILQGADMHAVLSGGPLLALGKFNLCDVDEAARRLAVSRAQGLIQEAYDVGARSLLIASGRDPGEALRQRALDALALSIRELGAFARCQATTYELTLLVETFDQDRVIKQLLGPTRVSAEFIRDMRQEVPLLGLTLDLSHLPQMREGIVEAVRAAGETVLHAHIANCYLKDPASPLYGDKHVPFGVPGSEISAGSIVEFVDALFEAGLGERRLPHPKPVISLEIMPPPGEDPDEVLDSTKMHFSSALGSWR